MSDTITKFTYQTFQKSKAGFALAHKQISTYLENFICPNLGLKTKPLSAKVIQKILPWLDKNELAIATSQTQNPILLKLNYYSIYCLKLLLYLPLSLLVTP
ncbi:MAG: hypothetical protein MGF17_16245 [Trichodesmium sp. MAG_R04]|nr:hypothetical protein [Trichodesmium sp. MAG_R04]